MGANSGGQISNLTSRIADLETQIVPLVDRIGQIDRYAKIYSKSEYNKVKSVPVHNEVMYS